MFSRKSAGLLCLVLFATTPLHRDGIAAAGDEARAVRRRLASIQAEGRTKVADLVRRIGETQDVALRESLSRQIVETKLDTDLEVLRGQASLARSRGDESTARQFENSIAMLLRPVITAEVIRSTKPAGPLAEETREGTMSTPSRFDSWAPPLADLYDDAGEPSLTAAGNIDNTVTMVGWSGPVVARNDTWCPGDNCVPSATLDGDSLKTWVSFSWRQSGTFPSYDYGIRIDDQFALGYFPTGGTWTPFDYLATNWGPFTVRGGRHTVRSITDSAGVAAEDNESDNTHAAQYIWNPPTLLWATPRVRAVPPSPGSGFPLVNSDGFRFTRGPTVAWVIGEAARNAGDDYDLTLFDDYSGASSGFSNAIGNSRWGGNYTDFVAGHYSNTPSTLYPGVERFTTLGGGGAYAIDPIDATARNGVANVANSYLGQVLPANRLVDVYEAYFTSGTQWYFTLRRRSGPSDMVLEVFPGTIGAVHRRGVGAASLPLGGSPDVDVVGPYTATVTGWHPIVVYRNDGTNSDQPVTYDLFWSPAGSVGVPDRVSEPVQFLGATPNPLSDGGSFGFVLPAAGGVRLALFDVRGRRIRSLVEGIFGAGQQNVHWDGRDESGERVGAGMYWARFETGDDSFTRPVVLVH